MMIRVLVVSNPTIDHVLTSEGDKQVRVGGPGFYAGLYSSIIGSLVYAYGSARPQHVEFIRRAYNKVGVKALIKPGQCTQEFDLIYTRGSRIVRSRSYCPLPSNNSLNKLGLFDVVIWSPTLIVENGDLAFLTPVFDGFLAVDVQGVARSRRFIADFFRVAYRCEVDVIHGDVNEVSILLGLERGENLKEKLELLPCREVIVSNGRESLLVRNERGYVYKVDPPMRVQERESTGAGDVLLATFSVLRTKMNLEESIKLAVSIATLHVHALNYGDGFSAEDAKKFSAKVKIGRI